MPADIGATNWNEADANNSSVSPDGAPEGMSPSGLNDTMRAMMGANKRWYNQSIPKVTAGSSTVYTLTYSVSRGALTDGMPHLIRFHTTNGAAPTLNVDGLGAKPLFAYIAGTWMAAPEGSFPTDYIARIVYDSSSGNYRILGMHTCLGVKGFTGSPAVVDFINIPATAGKIDLGLYVFPNSGPIDIGLQVYRDGVLSATLYSWTAVSFTTAGGTPSSAGSASATAITLAGSVASGNGAGGNVKLETAAGVSNVIQYQTTYIQGTTMIGIVGSGSNNQSGTITGLRVGVSLGTVAVVSFASLHATI